MDIADMAEVQEALARQVALVRRQKEGPAFTGCCANCGDEVQPPARWCDLDCKSDWEKREGA